MNICMPNWYGQSSRKGLSSVLKKRMLSSRVSLLMVVLCVGLTSVVLACSSDRHESFYPYLADAKKNGAIDHGWIPEFLPESSRAIHELHHISPSTTWCAFEYLPSDSKGLQKTLRSINGLPPSLRRVPSPGVSWWPVVLEGNLDVEKINKAGFELYVLERPDTPSSAEVLLVTVDWQKGRGFFYRTRE